MTRSCPAALCPFRSVSPDHVTLIHSPQLIRYVSVCLDLLCTEVKSSYSDQVHVVQWSLPTVQGTEIDKCQDVILVYHGDTDDVGDN